MISKSTRIVPLLALSLAGAACGGKAAPAAAVSSEQHTEAVALYGQRCARCHGVLGKGDGPDAKTLTPRPRNARARDRSRRRGSRKEPRDAGAPGLGCASRAAPCAHAAPARARGLAAVKPHACELFANPVW
jgi:hypothetical protein